MFSKTGGIKGFFQKYLLSFVMFVAGSVFVVLGSQAYIAQPSNIMYMITTYVGGLLVLLSIVAAMLQDKIARITSLEHEVKTLKEKVK